MFLSVDLNTIVCGEKNRLIGKWDGSFECPQTYALVEN